MRRKSAEPRVGRMSKAFELHLGAPCLSPARPPPRSPQTRKRTAQIKQPCVGSMIRTFELHGGTMPVPSLPAPSLPQCANHQQHTKVQLRCLHWKAPRPPTSQPAGWPANQSTSQQQAASSKQKQTARQPASQPASQRQTRSSQQRPNDKQPIVSSQPINHARSIGSVED